jgi:cytochrome c oxidase assembly factor CtaG
MNIAYAHGALDHVHHVGGIDWLVNWTFDPTFLIPLIAAILYFRGIRHYRRQGGKRFPWWRQAFFAGGVFWVFVALDSPVDTLSDWSFTWHMIQHELLMVVAVPCILLGTPFLPVVWGLPEGFRKHVFIPFARSRAVQAVLKTLTHPVAGLLAYIGFVWGWHMPRLYDAALFNNYIHLGEHFSFVVGALLFWWNIITPYPFSSRINVFLRLLLVILSEIPNIGLSALITFSDHVIYGYKLLPGFWGLDMLDEQQLGGLLMWVGFGATIRLIAAITVLAVYFQEEETKEPWKKAALAARHPATAP